MRRLAILVLALAAAGCGGGGDKPDPTPTPDLSGRTIPLERYIARADRICARGGRKVRERLRPLQAQISADGTVTPDEAMILNDTGGKLARFVLDDIAALPPPDRHREAAEAYTRALRDTLDTLAEAVGRYNPGDRDAAQDALRRNRALAGDIVDAAKAVGFKRCGTELSRPRPGRGRA
jgi:hypothetical protein